ncbi:MAG: hypothetical protein ABIH18_05955 [Candidatus Omnitrophota bacterium]
MKTKEKDYSYLSITLLPYNITDGQGGSYKVKWINLTNYWDINYNGAFTGYIAYKIFHGLIKP